VVDVLLPWCNIKFVVKYPSLDSLELFDILAVGCKLLPLSALLNVAIDHACITTPWVIIWLAQPLVVCCPLLLGHRLLMMLLLLLLPVIASACGSSSMFVACCPSVGAVCPCACSELVAVDAVTTSLMAMLLVSDGALAGCSVPIVLEGLGIAVELLVSLFCVPVEGV